MKKAIGIALALIFLVYLGGIQLFYSLEIGTAKRQSQEQIKTHSISLDNTCNFSFTQEEYNSIAWTERNKEFTYKGIRYDIVGIQFYSDEIKIKCFDDSRETNLFREFAGFMTRMFSPHQNGNDNNTDIAGKIYKEYLPNEFTAPLFFHHVSTTIKADRVLVNAFAPIDNIWHPPALA